MKALKTLFVWILLIALPLQGFAAVSTSLCESGKAALVAAAAADQDDRSVAAPGEAGDCDHHQVPPPEETAKDCDTPSDTAKCSACAAGSVGPFITVAFATLPALNTHGAEAIPYVAAHDTACIYGALERPPHTLA
jgi:hypothetical protein